MRAAARAISGSTRPTPGRGSWTRGAANFRCPHSARSSVGCRAGERSTHWNTPMLGEICESNPEARRACRVCGGPIIDGCDCETMTTNQQPRAVLQDWVQERPFMQQTVLLTAIRGPDGIAKYSSVKLLLRWYRRCVLLS